MGLIAFLGAKFDIHQRQIGIFQHFRPMGFAGGGRGIQYGV